MTENEWSEQLKDILPVVLDFRHRLHRHPEVGGEEKNTKQAVYEVMSALGAEIREFDGCYALTAAFRNGEGPCVAIRADMDALPIEEKTGLPFVSECKGKMHACGHDVHMSLAYGSALWLTAHKDAWKGTVKYLFEPMEETVGGGKIMVEQGCMENPHVDFVFGQHVNPRYEAGTFFAKPGYVSGSSDELLLKVYGKKCHGAYPESGVDAIVITAQIVSALQQLVSRTISPFDPAVITLGTINGGVAGNVVCEEVKLIGTLRTLNDRTRTKLKEEIRRTVEGIAASMGGSAEVIINPGYGAVYNEDRAYAAMERAAAEIVGEKKIVRRDQASLGVESFCYFEQNTPGVYYDIGSGISTALHTDTFLVDEACFVPGIAFQCASVITLLKELAE